MSSVTPWLTSASASLAAQTPLSVSAAAFTIPIPGQSVVTFTGQAILANSPPSLAAITSFATNVGIQLNITNQASDVDVPAQTLTFLLLSGPTNALLNTANGIFTWRPMVAQATTTNQITVKVSDSGTPSLSATNRYTITVNPLAASGFNAINLTGGQVILTATGALGPDYTLLTSTNLVNWQPLFVTNPTVMPVQLSTPNSAEPQRFFRLQPGP